MTLTLIFALFYIFLYDFSLFLKFLREIEFMNGIGV